VLVPPATNANKICMSGIFHAFILIQVDVPSFFLWQLLQLISFNIWTVWCSEFNSNHWFVIWTFFASTHRVSWHIGDLFSKSKWLASEALITSIPWDLWIYQAGVTLSVLTPHQKSPFPCNWHSSQWQENKKLEYIFSFWIKTIVMTISLALFQKVHAGSISVDQWIMTLNEEDVFCYCCHHHHLVIPKAKWTRVSINSCNGGKIASCHEMALWKLHLLMIPVMKDEAETRNLSEGNCLISEKNLFGLYLFPLYHSLSRQWCGWLGYLFNYEHKKWQ
jgi:hypothetical protein